MTPDEPPLTITIPTRDRPEQLLRTLDALDAQTQQNFEILVVDDGDEDPVVAERAARDPRLRVHRGPRKGLSRARNICWQEARTEWLVLLDDDCLPDPDFVEQIRAAMRRHPEATVISGHVGAGGDPRDDDYIEVTVAPVSEESVLRGRWVRPWRIGFTLAMVLRRSDLERLGGYDERLGPGVREFPSAEDMDVNYRLLRDGAIAYVTPDIRAHHDQWRGTSALGPHFRGYMAGWSGFCMKHLRSGDVLGGLWHYTAALQDIGRMASSAVKRRSALRARITAWKLRGLVHGTLTGARASW